MRGVEGQQLLPSLKHFHTILLFVVSECWSHLSPPPSGAVWMGPIRPDCINLTHKQIIGAT